MLRSLFVAPSVPPGQVWKEILWAALITYFGHIIGYVAVAFFRASEFVHPVQWGSVMVMIIAGVLFSALRFPFLATQRISAGLGIIIVAEYYSGHQSMFLIGFGCILVLRGFSDGPLPRRA